MATQTLSYGPHSLQTITVTTLSDPPTTTTGYWVIFIHGGAWRDPTQPSTTFSPAQSILQSTPPYPSTTLPYIAGFASLNYRLSPHPSHPQDPSTDSTHLRNATHPDHLRDVQSALRLLQARFSFGERYVLVGHSCGATLAFQSVMPALSRAGSAPDPKGEGEGEVSPPTAILGTAGIYDLRLLRDNHRDMAVYQEFVESAFGKDEGVWDAVSPAKVGGVAGVEGWRGGRVVVLAHSPEDALVDASQGEAMRWALTGWESAQGQGRRVVMLPVKGGHDDVWEKGEELARAISLTVEELLKMGLASAF